MSCRGGILWDEAIYRGYCPLGEPEVAIHATNLFYDLLPFYAADLLSFSPTLLPFTLGTHSYPPLLLYLCYHGFLYLFFLRHRRGARVCFIPRLMAATTRLLILGRLIRHSTPSILFLVVLHFSGIAV